MFKLFQFLYRIRLFLFFILLELFNLVEIYYRNNFHYSLFFNTSNQWISTLINQQNTIEDYLSLKYENELLIDENARLNAQLFGSRLGGLADSLDQGGNLDSKNEYIVLSAEIIYNSVNSSKNFLTINKGKLDGVEEGMGVISSKGIVGKVIKTIDHYAIVISILNTENSVSAKIVSNQELGYVNWNGKQPEIVDLNDISKYKRVEIGDSIVTSDYNTVFPPNILIGIVAKLGIKEDGNYREIKVLLGNQFNKLKHVYLVKNKDKKEIDYLLNEINALKKDEE